MHAVVSRRYGGPEVVEWAELPDPAPQAGELLVRVEATDLSTADAALRSGSPFAARLFAGLAQAALRSCWAPISPGTSSGSARESPASRSATRCGARPAPRWARTPNWWSSPRTARSRSGRRLSRRRMPHPSSMRPRCRSCATPPVCSPASGSSSTARRAPSAPRPSSSRSTWGRRSPRCAARARLDLVRELGAAHAYDYRSVDVTSLPDRYDVVFDVVGTMGYRRARRILTRTGRYLITVPTFGALAWHALTLGSRGRRSRIAFTGLRKASIVRGDLEATSALVSAGTDPRGRRRRLPVLERAGRARSRRAREGRATSSSRRDLGGVGLSGRPAYPGGVSPDIPVRDVRVGVDGIARCAWAGDDAEYRRYHDEEWGGRCTATGRSSRR